MEKKISATEAKRRFSKLLRAVKAGQSCVVTSHGRPVARIESIKEQSQSQAKAVLLARLKAQPALRQPIGRWKRDDLYD